MYGSRLNSVAGRLSRAAITRTPNAIDRQVLLVGEPPVASNEGVEAGSCDESEEFSVLRSAPAAALRGLDLVMLG